jgi:hypothetical protein
MDQGGGSGLYIYSQYMSDGDVVEIKLGPSRINPILFDFSWSARRHWGIAP